MGSYTSVVNNTDCVMYIIYGPNSLGLTIAQLATAVLGFVAAIPTGGASLELVVALETMESVLDVVGTVLDVTEKAIEVSAQRAGLHGPYGNGAKYTSEKLSLSLVHQANVVAVQKNSDGTFTVYSGNFTVWSGATDGSTKNYNLSDHLGDLDKRIVTPVAQNGLSADVLKAKVASFKSLVQEHGLKV